MHRFGTIIAIALSTLLLVSMSLAQQTSSTAPTTATPSVAAASPNVPNPIRYSASLKDAQGTSSSSTMAAVSPIFPFTPWVSMFAAPKVSNGGPQEILAFGLEHTALGNATLSLPAVRRLIVSGIGSGGGDGVLANFMPNTTSWGAYFEGIGSAQSYAPGSFYQVTSMATINGIPNQIAATARVTAMGSQWGISFDFSRISDGPFLALYSLGGFPVATEVITNLSESLWSTTGTADDSYTTGKCPDCEPPWYGPDTDLTWKKGAYVSSPSGYIYLVDTLDLAATKLGVTFGGYSGASLTASGIPSFTITDEQFFVNVGGGSTFFSDLGAGANVYQCCAGLPVSGTGAPSGTSYIQANEFQVTSSGSVSQIDVAVGLISGVNSFYVDIDTDNNGQPGAVLASFPNLSSSTNFGDCCGLLSITGISGLNLSSGTNYWVVMGPTAFSSTTSEVWNLNSTNATGNVSYSTDGGKSWSSRGAQMLGAFDILGSASGKSMVKK